MLPLFTISMVLYPAVFFLSLRYRVVSSSSRQYIFTSHDNFDAGISDLACNNVRAFSVFDVSFSNKVSMVVRLSSRCVRTSPFLYFIINISFRTINDCIKTNKLMGMVQARKNSSEVYNVGCLGKITSFSETGDGRYQINLEGLNRFCLRIPVSFC